MTPCKNFFLVFISALLPLIAAAQSSGADVSPSVDSGASLSSQATKAVEQMVEKGAGGLTVGVGVRSKVTSLVRFGGIEPNTQYPIASASKFLTAATVMAVVDEGKLSLDKPVATWLPTLTGPAGKLTLRHLLSQTSGLAGAKGEGYDLAQDHRMTLEKSAFEIAQRPLVSRPGEVFAYGGPGFQIAGAAVEAATGKRWAQVFQEKLAAPLGMSRTYWMHLRIDRTDELPVSETLNPLLQGGAVSTAEDYLRFLSMIAQGGVYEGKRVLSKSAIDELLRDQTPEAQITPTGASLLQEAHYSLGSWCESWNASGVCDRNSSIGLFGVYPWVEKGTGRFGIVFLYNRKDAFRLWPEMEIIRDRVEY